MRQVRWQGGKKAELDEIKRALAISNIVFGALPGHPAVRHQLPASVNARYLMQGHLRAQARVFKRQL
jgi:hypothetical protein